jgi:hypothetical protein
MHNTAQMTLVSPSYSILYSSHCLHTSQNLLSRLAAAFSLRSADSRRCLRSATKLFRTSKRNATTSSALSKDSRLPYANKKPTQVSHNPPSLTCSEAECPVYQLLGANKCQRRGEYYIPSQPLADGHQGWACGSLIHLLTCSTAAKQYVK